MRKWMARLMLVVMVVGSLGLMSCGKDDDGWASKNIAGKAVAAAITNGIPPLAPTGTFTMYFDADKTYDIEGDGVNVANSEGTYEYEKMGDDTGEITLLDTTLGITMQIVLTYTDEGQGNYSAEVLTPGVGGTQAGTFVELEE